MQISLKTGIKVTQANKKGLLFAIEGIDGSGKSTIIKELASRTYPNSLGSTTPVLVRQPGGSLFAEKYRAACLNEDVSIQTQTMFYAALINDCYDKVINPALDRGDMVLSDRSFGTTFAYQGFPKNNEQLILNILNGLKNDIRADLTIYLSLPLETAISRESGTGRSVDRYSRMAMVEKELIKESYDYIYGAIPETSHLNVDDDTQKAIALVYASNTTTKRTVVIDATQPLNKVIADCYGAISEQFKLLNGKIENATV